MTKRKSDAMDARKPGSVQALSDLTINLRETGFFSCRLLVSPCNRRIQVLDYSAEDHLSLATCLRKLLQEYGFGKAWLRAGSSDWQALEAAGFEREACIVGYFGGADAGVFSLFTRPQRRERPRLERERALLFEIMAGRPRGTAGNLPQSYSTSIAGRSDAPALARLYGQTFASYPFPIDDPDYILQTMESDVLYRTVRDPEGVIVAAASADINRRLFNAEMTDFATLSSERGRGMAQYLLARLEIDMAEAGINNLYTLARACSSGMNRVFFNAGYAYTGTLVNNCHIGARFEDMNIWCKRLGA